MQQKMIFRIMLFLFGCMGSRLLLTYIAKNIKKKYLPYFGIITLIPVIGWIRILFFTPRNTGAEVFGGAIWWKKLRPVHMGLYATFSILAILKTNAYQILLVDTIIGFLAFVSYHLNILQYIINIR